MTSVSSVNEQCQVCGNDTKHMALMSTNAFGKPDLDTRPAEMMRSTMSLWIHRCHFCGYCATQLSKAPEYAKEVVSTILYQQQLKNPVFPELANYFLCAGMIYAAGKKYLAAGMTCLHAAWVCDDEQKQDLAVICRSQAIPFFQDGMASGASIGEQSGIDEAILADLFRRTGKFAEAIAISQEGLVLDTEDLLRKIFLFQIRLAGQGDLNCHRIDEIPADI